MTTNMLLKQQEIIQKSLDLQQRVDDFVADPTALSTDDFNTLKTDISNYITAYKDLLLLYDAEDPAYFSSSAFTDIFNHVQQSFLSYFVDTRPTATAFTNAENSLTETDPSIFSNNWQTNGMHLGFGQPYHDYIAKHKKTVISVEKSTFIDEFIAFDQLTKIPIIKKNLYTVIFNASSALDEKLDALFLDQLSVVPMITEEIETEIINQETGDVIIDSSSIDISISKSLREIITQIFVEDFVISRVRDAFGSNQKRADIYQAFDWNVEMTIKNNLKNVLPFENDATLTQVSIDATTIVKSFYTIDYFTALLNGKIDGSMLASDQDFIPKPTAPQITNFTEALSLNICHDCFVIPELTRLDITIDIDDKLSFDFSNPTTVNTEIQNIFDKGTTSTQNTLRSKGNASIVSISGIKTYQFVSIFYAIEADTNDITITSPSVPTPILRKNRVGVLAGTGMDQDAVLNTALNKAIQVAQFSKPGTSILNCKYSSWAVIRDGGTLYRTPIQNNNSILMRFIKK